jgi:ParB family chromosome partitioning protein
LGIPSTVIRSSGYIWSDRQKKRAGAIVTVDYTGKLLVVRGLIRPEDAKAKPADDEAASEETGEQKTPGLSTALANDLAAHRTAALRALLAGNVAVALAATAHALALPLFYDEEDSAFAFLAISPALRAEGIEDSPAMKSMSDQHAAWQGRLPEDEAALLDWLLTQDSSVVTGLIAYCLASTMRPVMDERSGQIASALSLDMAQWWKPTVPGYLGRVPKPLILEAVTEAKGANAAENLIALKKAEMAERAADLLTGTGWLPPMLRAA